MATVLCPQCGKDDMIQKVSAILAEQTHRVSGTTSESHTYTDKDGKTHYQSYSVPYNATQVSVLAQRLSAPTKPDAGSGISGTFVGCGAWLFAIFLVIVSGGWLIDYSHYPDQWHTSELILGILLAPFAIAAMVGASRVYKHSSDKYQERRTQVQNVEIPRWERAMQRWSQLYYCSRDDVVFIPDENKSAPVSQMAAYVYE